MGSISLIFNIFLGSIVILKLRIFWTNAGLKASCLLKIFPILLIKLLHSLIFDFSYWITSSLMPYLLLKADSVFTFLRAFWYSMLYFRCLNCIRSLLSKIKSLFTLPVTGSFIIRWISVWTIFLASTMSLRASSTSAALLFSKPFV